MTTIERGAALLFWDNDQIDSGIDLGVNHNNHFKLTQFAQCTFWQANFRFINFGTGGGYSFSNVTSSDRTKQFTALTRIGFNGNCFQRVD